MHPGDISDIIKAKAAEGDKPELEKQEGMVYHLWGNGELTCQKSGGLLWQRNLHQFKCPVLPDEFGIRLPRGNAEPGKSADTYIATSDMKLVQELRVLMAEWMLAYVKHIPIT